MDSEYWISELGRLFEKTTEAVEQEYIDATEELADQFNVALEILKDEFPENEIVQRTESVQATQPAGSSSRGNIVTGEVTSSAGVEKPRPEALHEIRNRCARIVNALGYNLPDIDHANGGTKNIVLVETKTHQQTQQTMNQDITVESILENISELSQPQEAITELREQVNTFNDELAKDSPDESVLNRILSQVKEQSPEIAAQLILLAVNHGVTSLLG